MKKAKQDGYLLRNSFSMFMILGLHMIIKMSKYQNIHEDNGSLSQNQQLHILSKQKENTSLKLQYGNANKNLSLILPSSHNKTFEQTTPQTLSKERQIVNKFLNHCFVSKNSLRLRIKNENHSGSEIRQEADQSKRESQFQREEQQRVDEIKEENVEEDYRFSVCSNNTESTKIKQQKLEKLEKKCLNLKSYPSDKQSLSFNQNYKLQIPFINLARFQSNSKKKAKSEQRQPIGSDQGSPNKVQIILPNINDVVLERHHQLKILHTKKKPKSEVFSNYIKNNEIFTNQGKKVHEKKLSVGTKLIISKHHHMFHKVGEGQKKILILKNNSLKK